MTDKVNNKKEKVLRTIFILSFIPYSIILIGGLFAAVFGFSFMSHHEQGFEAFCSVAGSLLSGMIFIPIVPISFSIQATTLINKLKKIPAKDVKVKDYILYCIAFTLLFLLVAFGGPVVGDFIEDKIQAREINAIYKESDELVVYNTAFADKHVVGDKTYDGDLFMIDWDKTEVTFVYAYTTGSTQISTYTLSKTTAEELDSLATKEGFTPNTYNFDNGNTFSIYSTSGTGANILSMTTPEGTFAYELDRNHYMNINSDSFIKIYNENYKDQ